MRLKSVCIPGRVIIFEDGKKICVPDKRRPIGVSPSIHIDGKDKYLHRYLMEVKLGRGLDCGEVVHHIDGNCHNYDLSNLMLIRACDHAIFHKCGRPKGMLASNKFSKKVVNNILKLHKKGFNYSEISKIVGVSDNAVRRYVLGIA